MKSPLARSPSITFTVCEVNAPAEPPPPAPSLWQRAGAQHLYVPPRAEMRPQRLAVALQGYAIGSFKLNCEETPFLVNERGLNLLDRIALGEESPPQNVDMGTMEAPPSPIVAPSYVVAAPAAPAARRSSQHSLDFTPVIVRPAAPASRHLPRANSLDISWPRKLRARSAFKSTDDGGGLARSVTVSCGLSDLLNASDRPREYFAEEAVKPPQLQALHALSTSANTLRRKVLDSLAHASGSLRASRIFDEKDASLLMSAKARSIKAHRRAFSLGPMCTTETKCESTIVPSPTAQADLHMLGNKTHSTCRFSSGFTILAKFSSNGSISKSLHHISNSASVLRRKVFKSHPNQPDTPSK